VHTCPGGKVGPATATPPARPGGRCGCGPPATRSAEARSPGPGPGNLRRRTGPQACPRGSGNPVTYNRAGRPTSARRRGRSRACPRRRVAARCLVPDAPRRRRGGCRRSHRCPARRSRRGADWSDRGSATPRRTTSTNLPARERGNGHKARRSVVLAERVSRFGTPAAPDVTFLTFRVDRRACLSPRPFSTATAGREWAVARAARPDRPRTPLVVLGNDVRAAGDVPSHGVRERRPS
jgi:hypothetical protein